MKRAIFVLLAFFALAAHSAEAPLVSAEVIRADKTGDVELRKIRYRSDGLIINGNLAVPKGTAKLPCIIDNRGGRWDLGVWTDDSADTLVRIAFADVDDVLNLIPLLEAEPRKTAALIARSAVHWPEKLPKTTPILLLHGTADWRAPVKTNAINMAAALFDAKVPFRMVIFEGAQHGVVEFRDEARRVMRDTYVRDRKPWPSLEPHGD